MPSETRDIRRADIAHRKQYEKFVLDNGDPTVSKLIHLWSYWNTEYFDGAFKVCPIILLAEPSKPSRLGDYSPVGAYGSRAQIRIRPSLLRGTHPHTLPGKEYEKGRFLLVADVCLHETIHLWQDEVMGDLEPTYHGHGPLFRDKSNEIGAKLGLPPVRTCKKRGKDAELPSCSQFPQNVRPADYYQGAYVRNADEPRPLKGRLERLLKDFTGEEIVQELMSMGVIGTRLPYTGQYENPVENLSAVGITDDVCSQCESPIFRHQWFIDAFQSACQERGIEPNLSSISLLASTLDDWISKRLSKKSYLGNKVFYDEKQHHFEENINKIVSQWEFIEISYLGERIEVPPVPDLEFLVTYREAIFTWIADRSRDSLNRIMAQFQTQEQAPAGYTH